MNRPEAGGHSGWPLVSYGETYGGSPVGTGEASAEGLREPVYFWDPVIAPSGMVFAPGGSFPEWDGDLLIGGLVTRDIVRLDLSGTGPDTRVTGEERLAQGIGRVRDLIVASDGSLMVLLDEPGGTTVQRLTRD